MNRKAIIVSCFILALCGCLSANGQSRPATRQLDKKNLVVKEWNTDMATNKRFLDHVTTYNSEGRKVEEKEYNLSGLQWSKKYEYDSAGRVSRELTYNEHGRLDNIRKAEYNEFGKKKVEYTYDAKGKLRKTKTFEYVVAQ